MISIIVPVYNVKPYLEQCVRSIIAQTFQDWECILVDDGSTDGSGELCDKLVSEDERLKVIHQKNQGVSAARNCGIDDSKGEYICFIDSDDWVGADYLTHLLSGITEKETDMVVTGAIHESSKPEIHAPKDYYILRIEPNYTDIFINHAGLFYSPWAIIYKSSIIKSNCIAFPKGLSFGEDTTFVFSYLQHVRDVVLAPFADYHYRIQASGSLSYRFGEERTIHRYDIWKMRQAFYIDKGMWNDISQENMYRELWAIVYDGLFSIKNPSFAYMKELLGLPEIEELKKWPNLFCVSNWVKSGILRRCTLLFYILRKVKLYGYRFYKSQVDYLGLR